MPTDAPEREAEQMLNDLWADEFGLISLPVDPIYIARRLGLEVYISAMEADMSAAIVASPGRQTSIYLNQWDAWVRQRFSCSHEIGHYLRRTASGAVDFGFVDRRNHLSASGVDPEERWANQFAAALLMPAALVRSSPQRNPAHLAQLFDVSPAAMGYRLQNLGLR